MDATKQTLKELIKEVKTLITNNEVTTGYIMYGDYFIELPYVSVDYQILARVNDFVQKYRGSLRTTDQSRVLTIRVHGNTKPQEIFKLKS